MENQMKDNLLLALTQSVIHGDADQSLQLTESALQSGLEPMQIIDDGLIPGMNEVGERFSSGDYFLPDLIIASDCMQRAMELLEPELNARQQKLLSAGTVILGTVKGDIHEIGKSLVGIMLTANGFTVYDLGVNVSTETFIGKLIEIKPDIIGLSALLTTTMTVQREVIAAIVNTGLRDKVKVIVGGSPVTRSWAEEIGADGYAEDAMGAVHLARELLAK